MRLSKIKLAGFKSFVDPTTINFVRNLTAVIGPNGCGKSNVIDAVRWVMGESSAKNLRGGSLTDVIFSGSSARKPVGQATVELLFDNAQGKLGGEYANYSEIAIKRQVTRDGQSNYFLNGQRCRRRDITDIFLGTGLGPRSYAIIEQGMISRVIDAKPEDLRIFVEEAAGISKYKERRRETENRIKHTQDNLSRLQDLRDELGNQLRHLERQSQAAERYKTLKSEEKELTGQLAALTWKRLDEEIKLYETQIRETLTALEKEQTSAQQVKTQQEKQRLEQIEINESLNEVQKQYYSVGADIAKIEQSIAHHQERYNQLKKDKLEAEAFLEKTQHQLKQDEESLLLLQDNVAKCEPIQDDITREADFLNEIHQQAEEALEAWRDKTTDLQQAAQVPTRLAEAEKAKIAQLERQIHQTSERRIRIESELQLYQEKDDAPEIAVLDEKIEQLQLRYDTVIAQIETIIESRKEVVHSLEALKPQMKVLQQDLNKAKGEQSALQMLQEIALGKNAEYRSQWLTAQGVGNVSFVAEKIEVKSGFENAVEMVLEGFLQAVSIDKGKMLSLSDSIHELNETDVCLVEWQDKNSDIVVNDQALVHYLQNSDHLPDTIYQLLNQVRVCQTLEAARKLLPTLPHNGSVITPDGYWLGQGWIRVKSPSKNDTGILQRVEKLKALNSTISQLEEKLEETQFQIESAEEKLKEFDLEKENKQHEKNKVQQEIVNYQGERRIKQNHLEQNQKRHKQITQELSECQEQCFHIQQEINTSRALLQKALDEMSQLNEEQEALLISKESLQEAVVSSRLKAKEAQDKKHEIALTLRTYKTQIDSIVANNERSSQQIEQAKHRLENIIETFEKSDEPVIGLKMDLEANLEKRIVIEDELHNIRDVASNCDNLLRELETQLNRHEQTSLTLRDNLERAKMQWQAVSVRRENALEKLTHTEMVLEELLASMPQNANEELWQQTLTQVEQKIQRLGAINLAAIEEYDAAKQRKEYLDTQSEDLIEALTTLENAIKKIDKETRTKFKETFDRINAGFTQKFPHLFGGGQASLLMTGEDLLDTGIGIVARPPGKKNSSIQLLSGGEKALTAVALVFSIFELNPAPFCMLDEVDAPLDDSNVGRFCNLVKDMSKTVQFIFISHNKLAIEMAQQLQGVTMREPGVSRLVTVDIEEAITMAQNGMEKSDAN